ncbi:MAG: hypothetical protein SGJ26_14860 [Nitrospirota bacterium]|nr:hypothetical protein [Nitrospirota bacterium]
MSVGRFFLGLALLTISLLSYKATTDPFAYDDWESSIFTVGEAVGGVTGAMILGLSIWAPLRFIRGSAKAPDIRSFTLYAAAALAAIFLTVRFFMETPLGKSDQLVFLSGVEQSCFLAQRAHSDNSSFSDAQLQGYCSCVASSLSKTVSKEEMKHFASRGFLPSSLQNKWQQAAEQCVQDLSHRPPERSP